jgi:hypothetical protein
LCQYGERKIKREKGKKEEEDISQRHGEHRGHKGI